MDRLRCYLVEKDSNGNLNAAVTDRPRAELPEGDVLIRVAFSSLNYKDALAATGHPGVARRLPLVPGIDAAGTVEESTAEAFAAGDEVLVTGYGLGSEQWGGWADYVRVPAEWVIRRPEGLSARTAMIYGTAGLTAALCVESLQRHGVGPASGEVVVTGASGGVGSLAVGILARIGYPVVAATGKPSAQRLLEQLGAATVVGREEVDDRTGKPLLPARWAGAVDAVGGNTLCTLLRSTRNRGLVAACGLVGGHELSLTVYPFLLRGVTLTGIDSAWSPRAQRTAIWNRLAGDWAVPRLESLANETSLDGLHHRVPEILAGKITGRVIVRTGAETGPA